MKYMRNRNKNAVIGIGTLIVFIAMVLVAAIASAVIIYTAEKLEQDAERTGAGAREDITGGLYVKNIEGRVNTNAVDRLYVYISLYGGNPNLDMKDVSFHVHAMPASAQWTTKDLKYNSATPGTADPPNNYFGTTEVSDPWGAFPSILDQYSILKVEIVLGGTETTLATLPPNSHFTLTIMQASGAPISYQEVTTPASYPTVANSIVSLNN